MYKYLPLITFEYPNSDTGYLRRRYVRVELADATHVKGYEFDTPNPSDTDKGQFKTYLLAKIPSFGVSLLRFSFQETDDAVRKWYQPDP